MCPFNFRYFKYLFCQSEQSEFVCELLRYFRLDERLTEPCRQQKTCKSIDKKVQMLIRSYTI